MRKFSIKYKIIALILVSIFVLLPMEKINEHTYSANNYKSVHICGSYWHLDFSPTHLSYFCDDYHKL